MPERYYQTHIRNIPMFANLSEMQAQWVTSAFQVYQYNAGDVILNQGDQVPGLMVIADGQAIRVQFAQNGQRIQQGAIYEGQFVYQNALFEQQIAGTYVQAVRPTTLLVLTRVAMSDLLSHHPELRPAFGLQRSQDHYMHDVHFKTQRENEKVLLKTRRHWFTVFRWLVLPFALVVLGAMLAAAFPQIGIFFIILTLIVGAAMAGYVYIEWMNDSVIVTDQRVIRITHTIMTLREVIDEVALESIQEANAEIATFDIAARVFRYGDVELKTAGAQGNFTLADVPNPEQLQELIIEDARNYRIADRNREREAMKAEVERWVQSPDQGGQRQTQSMSVVDTGGKAVQSNAEESQLKNIYNSPTGPLSPFVTAFNTQGGGIVYRKHWFIWSKAVILPSLWILGCILAGIFISLTPLGGLGIIGYAIVAVALLFGVVWFYWVDWDWRHDYYLIQDNNITIVNRRPLWLRNESDQVLLKQVDNVVAETQGLFQQLFKYGDVRVSLVGADHAKLFDNVANPRDIQAEITSRQRRMKQRELEAQERQQREIIGEYLSLYHERQEQPAPQQPNVYPDNGQLPYDMPQRPAVDRQADNPAYYQPQQRPPRPAASYPQQDNSYQAPRYPQQPAPRGQQSGYPQQGQQGSQQVNYPQQGQPAPSVPGTPQLSPSPLNRRPSISEGRPFQQGQNAYQNNQPSRPPRSPYRPGGQNAQNAGQGGGQAPPNQNPPPFNQRRQSSRPPKFPQRRDEP